MEALMSELVKAMRVAMDEVNHDDMNDILIDDSDEEMKKAIEVAAQQLLLQAPPQMLIPQRVMVSLKPGTQDYDAIQTQYTDGHGELVIPDDWLRLYELRLKSWLGTIRTLMEPDSKEAKMQASRWTRGTPQKPKGMLTVSPMGHRVLMYWTAGRYDANHAPQGCVYNHEVELFTYIPYPKIEDVKEKDEEGNETEKVIDKKIIVALVDGCKKYLVYRAVSIYLVSKKESELADKFNELSQI